MRCSDRASRRSQNGMAPMGMESHAGGADRIGYKDNEKANFAASRICANGTSVGHYFVAFCSSYHRNCHFIRDSSQGMHFIHPCRMQWKSGPIGSSSLESIHTANGKCAELTVAHPFIAHPLGREGDSMNPSVSAESKLKHTRHSKIETANLWKDSLSVPSSLVQYSSVVLYRATSMPRSDSDLRNDTQSPTYQLRSCLMSLVPEQVVTLIIFLLILISSTTESR
jgi:hypothetical protein